MLIKIFLFGETAQLSSLTCSPGTVRPPLHTEQQTELEITQPKQMHLKNSLWIIIMESETLEMKKLVFPLVKEFIWLVRNLSGYWFPAKEPSKSNIFSGKFLRKKKTKKKKKKRKPSIQEADSWLTAWLPGDTQLVVTTVLILLSGSRRNIWSWTAGGFFPRLRGLGWTCSLVQHHILLRSGNDKALSPEKAQTEVGWHSSLQEKVPRKLASFLASWHFGS